MRRANRSFKSIATYFRCRRGQVYERYRNYSLFVNVPKLTWTDVLELKLVSAIEKHGKDWVLLGSMFGTSANCVKNRAYLISRRAKFNNRRQRRACPPWQRAPPVLSKRACLKCGFVHRQVKR